MRRRSLNNLLRKAVHRPRRYLREVMDAMVELSVDEGWYVISDEDFTLIRERYQPSIIWRPGDLLERCLQIAGIQLRAKCSRCDRLKNEMNQGWGWCLTNLYTIVFELRERAKQKGLKDPVRWLPWYVIKFLSGLTSLGGRWLKVRRSEAE